MEERDLELNFKRKLLQIFKNIFYGFYICSIIEFCINKIKSNLYKNHQKLLNEEQPIIDIINSKAQNSLKLISDELKEKLLEKSNQLIKQ